MPSQLDDKELVLKCQQGESDAFTFLYDSYVKKIYNFIYYKTCHKETAEDLTSQTFIKAWNNINKFKITKGTFSAWLYQIARNNVIDFYRAQKQTDDIDDYWDIGESDNVEVDIDNQEKLSKVKDYLKTLKNEQREIVMMRLWQELSYQEIAKATGKSEASCKMVFSRTLGKMRKELAGVLIALMLMFCL